MSSGFISENVLEEKRKERQAEWDRVRTAEQPKEAPEEPYDSRSLFERLEENKRLKQEEYDKQHDIKNVVRGIDDDEAAFLDKVDEIKSEAEVKRIREERKELEEYKLMKDKLLEEEEQKRLKSEMIVKTNSKPNLIEGKKKQSKLLSGIVVRKRTANEEEKPCEKPSISNAKVPKTITALAGLGDYGSSSEDEDSTSNT